MKLLVAAATAVAVTAKVHEDRAAQILEIQQTPGVFWRAAASGRFAHQPPGASKPLCGVKGNWKKDIEEAVQRGEIKPFQSALTATAVPDDFDSEKHWPQCAKTIGDIRDQSMCGCCWAFAGAEAASDRMCIATNGTIQVALSAQDVCFCSEDDGCNGGQIQTPWQYIKDTGAVTGGQVNETGPFQGLCSDFSLPHCHHHGPQGSDPYPAEGTPGCPQQTSPKCPSKCDATASVDHKDFASDKYSFAGDVASASGESQIQQMIMEGGPVEAAFTVYSDFENYAGGIYHHVTGEVAGGHAIKIVGWGVDKGEKYWKIANSWNPFWGEGGYFRMRRGSGECGIEDAVVGSSTGAKWSKGKHPLEVVV